MSERISSSNYTFQGQVLSPAFSPPPSPSSDAESTNSVDEVDSRRQQPAMPKKRRMSQQQQQQQKQVFVNKKPKFPTKYHEMLQPLSPVTTLPVWSRNQQRHYQPLPVKPTDINVQLQIEFLKMMRICEADTIESFLQQHSENVDINQFNEDGQTFLHQACQRGDTTCARVLLKFGANPRIANRDGFTIRHLASFSGNSELLLLVSGLKTSVN